MVISTNTGETGREYRTAPIPMLEAENAAYYFYGEVR